MNLDILEQQIMYSKTQDLNTVYKNKARIMQKSIKIFQVIFAFVYLIVFKHLFFFVPIFGSIVVILFFSICFFITIKILKIFIYVIPILILPMFYISEYVILINTILGIIYLSQHFKTLKK